MDFRIPQEPASGAAPWLGAFAHPAFAIVWTASTSALIGIAMYDTASGWLMTTVDVDPFQVSLVHADDPRLQRMAVLDVLLNNADRKGGHALEGLDGAVYGVDHGICLHTDPKLRTVLWGWGGEPVEQELLADIGEFVRAIPGEVGDSLAEHITDEEIAALAKRGRRLLEHPVMPLPRSSRPIPWPAF